MEYNAIIADQEETFKSHFRRDVLPAAWKKITTSQHISHEDYVKLVLQFRDQIQHVPTIVAGENLNKGFVGEIMSGCGASFIPRGEGVSHEMANVHKALENVVVFIEGTRARGSKKIK